MNYHLVVIKGVPSSGKFHFTDTTVKFKGQKLDIVSMSLSLCTAKACTQQVSE